MLRLYCAHKYTNSSGQPDCMYDVSRPMSSVKNLFLGTPPVRTHSLPLRTSIRSEHNPLQSHLHGALIAPCVQISCSVLFCVRPFNAEQFSTSGNSPSIPHTFVLCTLCGLIYDHLSSRSRLTRESFGYSNNTAKHHRSKPKLPEHRSRHRPSNQTKRATTAYSALINSSRNT